jgi:penicillin-binding protein 1C
MVVALRCWNHVPFERRVPLSTAVWSADGELLRFTLAADDQYRLWTPLSEMPPALIEAFLLKEDQWFYWHPGVNPVAMVRAGFRSWRGSRQGGSTLTMQLARLLYRMNTKTPAGKLKQAGAALWLEARYSKRELLEAYLNVVPFGGNIQGAGAATRLYFGKAPDRLSAGEAITLAVIPQRPSARAGHTIHEAELQNARMRLAREWRKRHDDVALPMDLGIARAVPELAPHFVDALIGERAGRTGRVDTTLDAELQRLVQRQVARYIGQYGERGIQNAAALLVDTRDMGEKAWLGSADYRSEAIDGQVNGVLAKRSPGSTLKPFIYGLALDQGVLHPRTILKDAPTSFGPFTPENFDGRFLGPISAEEALVRSRNVPAVWVATQLKQPTLFQFLESAGVSKLQSEEHYGLSLALGGGEVTMEELAGMYAMLANQGVLHRLRVEKASKRDEGVRLLSAEASFVTVDMLRHNPRPDEDGTLAVRTRWPVAWKTGTSWGFRDAWTAGIVGPYVLVVWIGDFRGKSNPSFVGVEAAAPLFFRIADALNLARSNETLPAFVPPAGVSKVAVCAASGDLPNAWCPNTVDTWYIPGKSPIRMSQLHRAVAVDVNTGKAVCPPYDIEAVRWEVFEFWSSDMLKLFREAGVPRRKPPVQACAAMDSAEAPRISSPLRSVSYTFRRSAPTEVISLEASAAADVRQIFWFDGAALIGRAAVGEGALGWRPTADGAHLLRIIDDHGRAAERDVQVQFAP